MLALMKEIENKLNEIISIYNEDDNRNGGYSMTKYFHLTAPEDYNEYRLSYNDLMNQADDMYYMLQEIKSLANECKEIISKNNE